MAPGSLRGVYRDWLSVELFLGDIPGTGIVGSFPWAVTGLDLFPVCARSLVPHLDIEVIHTGVLPQLILPHSLKLPACKSHM